MSDPGLKIYTSNRLEALAEHLAEGLKAAPLPPLQSEYIVVQSQGMWRWLTLRLADRLGIAASLKMPFPASFCRRLAEDVLSGPSVAGFLAADPVSLARDRSSAFDTDNMAWRIFRAVSERIDDKEFAPLRAYLHDDPEGRKRYQLAVRVASLFDNYQIYRPDMLAAWESGKAPADDDPLPRHAAWQAALWSEISGAAGEEISLSAAYRRLTDRLGEGEPPAGLIPRLSVFAVTSLPPVFVEVLQGLARFIPVSVYVVSPTWHFWGHIRSERDQAWLRNRSQDGRRLIDEESAHEDEGNPLLAAFGRQGRELFNMLQHADDTGSAWQELEFERPSADGVLGRIQAGVFELVSGGPGTEIAEGDRSFEVHVCHSPMREMEVLRDQLLEAFDRDPTLRPHDVLVLVPDIAKYGPYIRAVFGVEHEGTPQMPISVADLSIGQERPLAGAVMAILSLVGGRVTVPEVIDLLETRPLRRAFGIRGDEIDLIREWLSETNTRWGIDAGHRQETFGLPAGLEANTWRAGIDRMLMGYATGQVDGLAAGILPYVCGAADAGLVGNLANFTDRLFKRLRDMERPRSFHAWSEELMGLLGEFFDVDPREEGAEAQERALQAVRDEVSQLARASGEEGVSLAVVRAHLEHCLANDTFGRGFMSGAVTFASLKPMRTIPRRIICVAGLGGEEFPRRHTPLGFDIMSAAPRRGDRSLRDDDRYLFLETILAARERLIISYVGRSQKDNSVIVPSTVLSELLEHVDRGFESPREGVGAGEALTVQHPLQPFSPRYYDGSDNRLFSYSRENCQASRAGAAEAEQTRFVDGELPEPEGDEEHITLDQLRRFWADPAADFCRNVLGIRVRDDDTEDDDAEPFSLDSLERYSVLERMVPARRSAGGAAGDEPSDDNAEHRELAAAGELPMGGLGDAYYAGLAWAAEQAARPLREFSERAPVEINLEGRCQRSDRRWRLSGEVEGMTDRGLLRYRPASIKPKDRLRARVDRAALATWGAEQGKTEVAGVETHLCGQNEGEYEMLRPPSEPRAVLETLVEGYLEARRRPLPFFPSTSEKCAKTFAKTGDEEAALQHARSEFSPRQGDDFSAESERDAAVLAFRGQDPLEAHRDEFLDWAKRIWADDWTEDEGEEGS